MGVGEAPWEECALPCAQVAERLSADWRPVPAEGLPAVFTGGWVGYCGYDTVRYVYSGAGARGDLPASSPAMSLGTH